MRVVILASSSAGNAILVEARNTAVLIDAGLSARELERRLFEVGRRPQDLAALVLTHEHGDHVRGAGAFARRWRVPTWATAGTLAACADRFDGSEERRCLTPGTALRLGDLVLEAWPTVHDAAEPVALVVEDPASDRRIGVATDLGRPTQAVRAALARCQGLVLEANHDEELLRRSPYPPSVQQRIAGPFGHLSNDAAADLLRDLAGAQLHWVALAHLSERANDPDRAFEAARRALAQRRWNGQLAVVPPRRCVEAPRWRDTATQLSLW
jgi:phosphoribosyl 1,2-cyclic phosphodiesterase